MIDAEREIKKATDTLLRLLQESGDKAQAIANYYASVAYWELKGAGIPDLPDAAAELMKAEEAKAFMEHRKKYAANKATEEKKKEDAYLSKFFWAMCLVFVIYLPAYWSHGKALSENRQLRAKEFIKTHVASLKYGDVKYGDLKPGDISDYSVQFQQQFPDHKAALRKFQGSTFGSPEVTDEGQISYGQVVKVKVPINSLQLEYTVEDTSHGKKNPVIIATNELDITLPERIESPSRSPYPASNQPGQTNSPVVKHPVPSLGGSDVFEGAEAETTSEIPQQPGQTNSPAAQATQQDYNSQRQYQTSQEDDDRRRRAEEDHDRNLKRQWQQNAKDDFMQAPSLGENHDPGFEQ